MPLEATGKSGFQLALELTHPHFSLLAREFLQTLKLKVFQAVFMKVDNYLKPSVASLTLIQTLKTW